MIHGKWIRTIAIAATFGTLAMQGCHKKNGIDNNNVISTPYSLYAADSQGALLNTNDGVRFRTVFQADGKPIKSILMSGTNLLFSKDSLYLSTDDGNNFNFNRNSVTPAACLQSLIIDVPSHNRIYLASTHTNGIEYSEDHGKTWKDDTQWQELDPPSPKTPGRAYSFAQLKSGDLFYISVALSDDPTPVPINKLYKRTAVGNKWERVNINGLPVRYYYLSRLNDLLLASDTTGDGGVYFSSDRGANWSAYTGLPVGVNLNCTYAPFDQTVLVGTNGAGVYRLQSGVFVPSNSGLRPDIHGITKVWSIVAKSDTYKNTAVKNYVYAGTNTGLYRSEDGGQNWILVYPDKDAKIAEQFYRLY